MQQSPQDTNTAIPDQTLSTPEKKPGSQKSSGAPKTQASQALPSNKKSYSRKFQLLSTYAGFPFVAACAILLSVIMAFGNPHLWITQEQARATKFA